MGSKCGFLNSLPHPPSCSARHPPRPVGGGHSGAMVFGLALPCHCEGVRSTLETLAYDCGNPVQYVCGHSPAVLLYLLDRHASLAMTMESKCVFLNSLTTPPPPRVARNDKNKYSLLSVLCTLFSKKNAPTGRFFNFLCCLFVFPNHGFL